MLTAYQGIIHKVNRVYFRSEADRGQLSGNRLSALAIFPGIAKQGETRIVDL